MDFLHGWPRIASSAPYVCTPVSLGPSVCCVCPRTAFNIIYFYISILYISTFLHFYIYFSSLAVHIVIIRQVSTGLMRSFLPPPRTDLRQLSTHPATRVGTLYSSGRSLLSHTPTPPTHSPALSLNRSGNHWIQSSSFLDTLSRQTEVTRFSLSFVLFPSLT